ncbi:MAG: hypothetical protein WAR79_16620, partial [Melioribacteraceae bacterium]
PWLIALVRDELSEAEGWLDQAQRAFSDCSPELMLQPIYGTSGRSRADIIARYLKKRDLSQQLLNELEAGL